MLMEGGNTSGNLCSSELLGSVQFGLLGLHNSKLEICPNDCKLPDWSLRAGSKWALESSNRTLDWVIRDANEASASIGEVGGSRLSGRPVGLIDCKLAVGRMEYSGAVSESLNFGGVERGSSSLSGLSTELHEHRQRLPGLPPGAGSGMGMLLAGGCMKQCRSASELDLEEERRAGGPMKVARTDAFPCRELKMLQQHQQRLVRSSSSNCMQQLSEGRLACSPTNSSASDGTLLTHDGSNMVSEPRLVVSGARPGLPFQAYHYKPAGMALSMARDMGMHGIIAGVRPPFSPSQWQELEHQALIFKYMVAGVPVPPDLLIPIRKSVISLAAGSHHPNMMAWNSFHMGFANNADPEPGRCRRTDGKKWRCSRDVVPDQKYCERHMHRGRHRSRKPVEGQTNAASNINSQSTASSSTGASLSLAAAGNDTTLMRPSMSISSQQQQQSASILGAKNMSLGSQFHHQHHYPLHGSSVMGNKDYRYINGMKAADIDEQIFFSEASGSTINSGWRSISGSKPAGPHQSKNTGNGSLLQYESPQLRTLLGQDFGLMPEGTHGSIAMNNTNTQQQHHQHSFLSGTYNTVDPGGGREPEEQPLRHFFDDWPRSRDPSTISWSDVEEERSNRSSSTTQLSISIPMASSDFSASNSNSSPRGKLSLSPLKLSMSREDRSQGQEDPLGGDHIPIEMGLGVGHRHHHHQANWIPITWESPILGMGGPLAEVLQSSTTPRGCNNSTSLSLMNEGSWNNYNSTSPSPDSPPRNIFNMASSPTERGGAGRLGAIDTSKDID
eukprot:Gb_20443 [translate_table: standard]